MTSRFIDPIPQFCNDAGEPIAGGKLYFYDSGTTSFRNTYSDSGLTIANANPVILDAAGRPPSIFLQGNYKLVVTDANDVQISTRDPVSGTSTAGEYTDWSITTTYALNQSVRGSDGEYYVSITNDNLGNDPTTVAASWSKIVGLTDWNTNQTYALYDTVRRNGILYRSTANSNIGSAPESLVNWASLNPASTADAVVTIATPDTTVSSDGVGDVKIRPNGVDTARFDADQNTYLLGDLIMNEGAGNQRNIETDLVAIEADLATKAASTDISSLQSQISSNDSDISSLSSSKADTSGTYASLRAQATTKADVGLSNVPNYSSSTSSTSSSTTTLATSSAVKAVRDVAEAIRGINNTSNVSWSSVWTGSTSALTITLDQGTYRGTNSEGREAHMLVLGSYSGYVPDVASWATWGLTTGGQGTALNYLVLENGQVRFYTGSTGKTLTKLERMP